MRIGLPTLLVAIAVAGATNLGSGMAATSGSNPCMPELPKTLAAACVAPGVTCKVKEDAHKRWELVYGTEVTRAHAEATLAKARAKGLQSTIEVDVRCSNGAGVYEVAKPGFMSHAAAAALVARMKALGFGTARTEDS